MNIPPRWLHCPRKGNLVANIFLPFKTPLDSKYDNDVSDEFRFKPQMLFTYLQTLKLDLGLVIDLTNTTRFYNPDEFTSNEIKHQKIACKGHDECPDANTVKLFVNLCDTYIRMNPHKKIGVHCTHGYNRTGYLICAYLVEKLDWSVEAAYHTFANMRPPGIIKGHYIKELYERYGEEEIPPPPSLPSWHTESDDSGDNSQTHNQPSPRLPSHFKKILKRRFFDAMEFEQVVQETDARVVYDVQNTVKQMCETHLSGFCGAQPVSMTQENMNMLCEKPFMVSWKADGARYLMLIKDRNQVYMLDRDNAVFQIRNLDFPLRKNLEEHLKNTLVDGELIVDEVEGRKIPRYLIYDIIKFQNEPVGKCGFKVRLGCIRREIIEPRNDKTRRGMLNRSNEPFSLRAKDFWDVRQACELLGDKFSKMVSHEVDGLIFQPASERPPNVDMYRSGRNSDMLKWKPSSLNSVDFLLKVTRETGVGLVPTLKGLLYVGQMDQPLSQMKMTKELKAYNNKIIECTFCQKTGWKMIRERTDKSFPNSYNTAKGGQSNLDLNILNLFFSADI